METSNICLIGVAEIENRKKWRKCWEISRTNQKHESTYTETKCISSRISKREPVQFPYKKTSE